MPTIRYYELMQRMEVQRACQGKWRNKMFVGLYSLKGCLADMLGVSAERYDDGQRDYVELRTEQDLPFHITNEDVVRHDSLKSVVTAKMIVAVEFEGGIVPCESLIHARYRLGQVEFKIAHRSKWTTNLSVMSSAIFNDLKRSLERSPLV